MTKSEHNIIEQKVELNEQGKIVIYCDGSWKFYQDGITWEPENDEDYLTTIPVNKLKDAAEE